MTERTPAHAAMQAATHPLDCLFRPGSVAIVGASSDPNKVGGRPLAFLARAGYAGRVYAVNPGAKGSVQGHAAYASLDDIGTTPDQVIAAVAPAQVLPLAQDCARRGVRALQIFSSGFGEGAQGAQAQAALRALTAAHGMRVLGPNSLGLFNTADGFFGTFATALDGAWPARGGVGVATQSGAFGSYFFGMAQAQGLGFSHFVATGNEADVDVTDCVDFLVHDAATRLIVIAMEGCRDGRKLARALLRARQAGKPVLAMKVGVSAAGAQAAATHTGSLAGEDRVFDAVLRDCGAYRADSLQALVDAACVATSGPLPAGRDLMIVTTSGGIGVLSADAAEASGMALPAISDGALQAIRGIAALADGRNPVDTSAGILGDLSAYARIAAQALADRPCHAVLCYMAHITRNPAHWAQLREPLYALRASHPHAAFVAVALADETITADLRAHGFAVFTDPTRAVRAVAACVARESVPLHLAEPAENLAVDEPAGAGLRLPGRADTESAAKAALAACGIRFAPEVAVAASHAEPASGGHADSLGDAVVKAARRIGWPVVLKVISPDIAHKTEAGGVRLGLADEATLRQAVGQMHDRVRAWRPDARIDGYLVARQLKGGVEVLVGTQRDPVFGPVITVGSGGVMTELLDDVCMRLAPVDEAGARQMLASTRAGRLLDGWRGAPAADIDALAGQIATLSRIAWANRDHIAGIDLNPVLALPDGAYAVDALIVPGTDASAQENPETVQGGTPTGAKTGEPA